MQSQMKRNNAVIPNRPQKKNIIFWNIEENETRFVILYAFIISQSKDSSC